MNLKEFLELGKANQGISLNNKVSKNTATKVLSAVAYNILVNPRHYDQRKWVCGTSFCIGGDIARRFKGVKIERGGYGDIRKDGYCAADLADKVLDYFIDEGGVYSYHCSGNVYGRLYDQKHYKKSLIAVALLYNVYKGQELKDAERKQVINLIKELEELKEIFH